MNIYFVTTEFLNKEKNGLLDGGVANEYYKFAKQLIKFGHNVKIIVCTAEKKQKYIFEGIEVIEFNPRKYFRIIRRLIFYVKKLFHKELRQMSARQYLFLDGINKFLFIESLFNRIDIVQYTSDYRIGVFPLKRIPSCLRIASYTKNFLLEYGYADDKVAIKEEKLLYNNTRFIFGPSKFIANMIKEDLNLKQDIKIIETPFLKPTMELNYEYAEKLKNKKYVLFFGTLGILKGCFDVAEVIYRILKENKDLHFVFVGKQIEYNNILPINYIKEKAVEYSDRVIYFDKMQHKYLYPLIQNASFCLMPSRTENFSNTCLEAMGFGKTVIGSEPFFNQIITDGVNGFLCKAKDPDSIYKKVCEVLNLSSEQKENIEKNALKRINECAPEDKTKELVEYYKYVINNWK